MNSITKKITALALGGIIGMAGVDAASAATYTVKSGDTLTKIGKNYGIPYKEIMEQNNLKSTTIYVGQKITINENKNVSSTATSQETTAKATVMKTHTVVKGENLTKIAAKYGLTYKDLMSWNNLKTTTIYPGQKLNLAKTNTTPSTSSTTSIIVNENEATNSGDKIASIAKKYQGIKYVFGGTSTTGFDCSGYVYYVFKEAGYKINRLTAEGYYNKSTKTSNPKVGDLVFFSNTYKQGVSHMGIYVGNGNMIHASTSGGVKIEKIQSAYWKDHFTGYGSI